MRIGISAYFIKKENVLPFFRKAVEEGIFFFELPFEIPHIEIMNGRFFKEVETLKEMGASFSLHGPWIECNLGSLFREIRSFSRTRILKSIDFAESWGLNPLIIHPGFNFFKEREIENLSRSYFFEEIAFIVSYAQKKNVDLCIENVPFALSFFKEIGDFIEIKKNFPLRVCYDLGHALITKNQAGARSVEDTIIEEILKHKEDIAHIHFHNNNGRTDSHLLYSGVLDMRKILDALREMAFQGRIVIESEDVETYGISYFLEWIKGRNT